MPNTKHQTNTNSQIPRPLRFQHRVEVWCLKVVWCLVFGFWCFIANAQETNAASKPFVPSTKYATTRVAGWTVRVNRELLTTQSELGSNALTLLSMKLREITNTLPARACEALKRVPIWLGVNDGHAPCAEYHPSK